MGPLEIIVIICAVSIVLGVVINYIYKRIKNIPTGDCCECKKRGKNLVKQYHKMYKNDKSFTQCDCKNNKK